VYALPWPYDDLLEPPQTLALAWHAPLAKLQRETWGSRPRWDEHVRTAGENASWLFVEDSHTLGDVVGRRLRTSRCVVTDASQADVFVIPLLLRMKHTDEAEQQCRLIRAHSDGYRALLPLLPHLTHANAHRHILFRPNAAHCDGWWHSPIRQLLRVRRFLSAPVPYGGAPGAAGVPYPSVVSARRTPAGGLPQAPPWASAHARTVCMAYSGTTRPLGLEADPRAKLLRAKLVGSCATPTSACACAWRNSKNREGLSVGAEFWELYAQAHFCLQPIGDSCGRKGIVDALLLGCIPVLFHACQRHLWQLNWGGWLDDASVFIDADAVINGSVDVGRLLLAVPEARRAAMRDVIQRKAHLMHYSLDEPGADEPADALSLILDAVATSSPGAHVLGGDGRRYDGDRLMTVREFLSSYICGARRYRRCVVPGVLEGGALTLALPLLLLGWWCWWRRRRKEGWQAWQRVVRE
jgi:hypothetical protein